MSTISACLPVYSFPLPFGDQTVDSDERTLIEDAHSPANGSSPSDSAWEASQIPLELLRPSFLQAEGPSLDVQQRVADILQSVAFTPLKDDLDPLVSAQHYYPVWCVLLYATVGAGFGTGIDFQTGAEHPNSGLHNLPALVVGLGQAGDTKITWDGIRGALAGREQELEACRVYLSAASGLQALAGLEAEFLRRPPGAQNPRDLSLLKEAQARLRALADTHAATFKQCLEPGHLIPRCLLAGVRDVGFGSLSLLKTVPSAVVSGLSTSGPLTGAAKNIAVALPYLSGSMNMVTGVLHILQAVCEGMDARRERKTLLLAERFDKNVFEAHGADCPELLELMEHRHQWRELKRLDANLLDLHGWIRGIYGGTSLGGAVAATALTALGGGALFGAATMGIPGLVGILLAGGYMLWYGIRAKVRAAEQKRHDKACRAVAAHHDRKTGAMPGLADPDQGRPIQAIARSLVDRLLAPTTQHRTRQMLIALGLSPSVIDAAIHGDREPLTRLIVQLGSQASSPSEAEALRRFHARSDVSAWDQLMALDRWQALGHAPTDIARPAEPVQPRWTRHLAPGTGMGDLRQSSLTPRLIHRHWNDEGFQPFLRRLCVHTHEVMNTPQDAWDLLQTRRHEAKQEAQARATVAGWIAGGQWRNIEICLRDDHDFANVKYQQVLQNGYGISPRDAGGFLTVLQGHARTAPLQTDTLASFMSICQASDAAGKRQLVPHVQALVEATVKGMPSEGEAFYAALGITSLHDMDARNVDAVLRLLQQFLSVSEKLRGQTLSKVVASLHAYPTGGGFPEALCRLAALRELRLRCETAGRSVEDPDVQHALAMARQLSGQKLDTWTIGAGEGGGVFGFKGYRLNDEGAFIRYLFERCLGSPLSPLNLSSTSLGKLSLASADPTHQAALYSAPGALEKALQSRDPRQRKTALACLEAQLHTARERAEAAPDASGCVTHLQAFFRLEKLAQQHGVATSTPRLGHPLDPNRLNFYRAALAWPNKTARAKNIQAIQTELDQLKRGHATGNPFWSAKFLRSQKIAGAAELQKMRALHPEIAAGSYKGLVKALQALSRMGVAALRQAIHRDTEKARQWIQVHFRSRGVPLPSDWQEGLKEAAQKGPLDLLMALSALKDRAAQQHSKELAKRLWSHAGSGIHMGLTHSTKTPSSDAPL